MVLLSKRFFESGWIDDNEDEDKDGAEDDVNDDERRKNAQKLDYLVGGEQRIITIQEHDNVWIVNNTNISRNFHVFRNRCIDMLEHGRVCINHTRGLALNGIMWLDDKNRRYYAKIVEVLADDFEAGERQAGESYCSVVNTNDNNMKLIAKTVLNLIRKFRKTNAPEMKEPLFCSFLIESIVTPFLCLDEDCLTLLGNTDESPGSRMVAVPISQ
ncbi:hypothetical protein V8B55DRAFT_1345227 [Mucor lusitanicus]|uniref:Uncharacterized protein n=1 Tax=Mucor circinelloides f. lusitanicus TaxID=29924 RepID=A0A8H4EW18_MUCCL|nr:hypothetical protein FB192DRAFT_1452886 [Mucor lusitanicus]